MSGRTLAGLRRGGLCLALLSLACGRTGFGFGDDGAAADDGTFEVDPEDGAEGGGNEPAGDEPLQPDESTCGDGRIEPGEVCFSPQVTFASRIDPCAIDLGDLDGDGHLDVAVPNSDFGHDEAPDNYASVLYGDGLGGLSAPNASLAGGDFVVGVTIGDVDVDGRDDLVVANNESASIHALLATGPRSYALPIPAAGGDTPVTTDLGDLDGDGLPDVVVAAAGTGAVLVAAGLGDGHFGSPVPLGGELYAWRVRLFDADADGDLDVAATDNAGTAVHVWRNEAEGLIPTDPVEVGPQPSGLTPADLDADGDVDLLVASDLTTQVRLNRGDGTFEAAEDIEAGDGPWSVAVADFDRDGHLDAAILSRFSQDVTIAVGDGTGRFEPVAAYAVGRNPSGVVAGDFNEDGVDDLAVSNQDDNDVSLILSNP